LQLNLKDEQQVRVNRSHEMLRYTGNMLMLFDAANGALIQVCASACAALV
jgi:hypothetical protein